MTLSAIRFALLGMLVSKAVVAHRATSWPHPTVVAIPEIGSSGVPPKSIIQLEPWRTRWTLRARIGGASRRLLLDTGGGITLVSPGIAKAAGCDPWGRRTGFNMFGQRFDGPMCDGLPVEIGDVRYVPAVTGLVNMAKLNPADSTLDGIAALDLFDGQVITLDLGRGQLIVESAGSLADRIASMRPLPIRLKREVEGLALAVMVGVPTAKGRLWMELDSGNGGTVLVSKPVASLVGLDSALAGRQQADFALLDGLRVRTADAFTPELIMDGNLGMPVLRGVIVTLDLRAGTGWIASAGTSESPSR